MKNSHQQSEVPQEIFKIRRIGDLDDEEIGHNDMPHLHDYYTIFWVESGEAIHATDFVEYSLLADTILFVPPGLKHRMYIDKSVSGAYILFNDEFIQFNQKNYVSLKEYRIFNNPEFKSLIKLDENNRDKFRNITNLIYNEAHQPDDYSKDIVLNLLHLFLLESRRVFDQQNQVPKESPETTPDTTIIRFKQLIEENFVREKNVSPYAEMLNINPSCLNELTKRITGITAGELIRNRVIDETKKLLYSSNFSGKEIAYELGFDDPAYFSRFFKKYTGTTLKEFRDNSRKKYH
ncbi:MAG TPA: helix-turn-helix domain-containing protein [Prolixibacteraceae bacterium]|nr:helix-turn-helix domain-containing protein [Prolixibacteraceae bacterium]